jgi:hypothetical protein
VHSSSSITAHDWDRFYSVHKKFRGIGQGWAALCLDSWRVFQDLCVYFTYNILKTPPDTQHAEPLAIHGPIKLGGNVLQLALLAYLHQNSRNPRALTF